MGIPVRFDTACTHAAAVPADVISPGAGTASASRGNCASKSAAMSRSVRIRFAEMRCAAGASASISMPTT